MQKERGELPADTEAEPNCFVFATEDRLTELAEGLNTKSWHLLTEKKFYVCTYGHDK